MLSFAIWIVLAAAPSEVIFPTQQLPLTFSHVRHLAKKIECDFCHDQAPGSHRSSDNLIPKEEVCATCHAIERAHPERDDKHAMGCARCHPTINNGVPARVVLPPPNIKFDHAVHVQKGIACLRCHPSVPRVDLATRAQLPTMSLCLGCHDSQAAKAAKAGGEPHGPSRCATCHVMRPDNTIETDYGAGEKLMPSGTLRGDAHTLEFRTQHASAAANDPQYCANCHRQDFCLGCHNGLVKPLDFHGNDYVSRHAIDARKDSPRCDSCHRAQSFCLGCHERLGVVDARTGVASAFAPAGPNRFHPVGWADPVAGANHHKWQAERNIKQCAACHRQETCLECHATNGSDAGAAGKMWVNPHPPDWRGSSRCQMLADRNPRVCLRCHPAADPLLRCR